VVLHQALVILVRARNDDGRLRRVQPVERLLVEAGNLTGAGDDLRLELVGANVAGEVVDDVEADGLYEVSGTREVRCERAARLTLEQRRRRSAATMTIVQTGDEVA